MNFGSLFSGIGGFDLGFERAGMTCSWQCEIDDKARSVLAKHWPGVKQFDDVRTVTKNNAEPVDLICGGFPCQDLSVAGKRAGLAGGRSGLWFEFHRILEEMRPQWVVIENVPGLLSSNRGADFAVVLRGLGDIGYLSAWRILDSQHFGVAQRRRRVFIVASLGDGRASEVLFEPESVPGNTPKGGKAGEEVAGTLGGGSANRGWCNDLDGSGAFIPQVTGTLDGKSCAANRGCQANETEFLAYNLHQNDDGRKDRPNGGLYVTEADKSLTLQTGEGKSKTLVTTPSGFRMTAFGEYEDDDSSSTLKQRDYKDATDLVAEINAPLVGVRRLTPVECSRLQGFPDEWNEGLADSHRYKQLGNAVTVNVAEWIGKRIMEVDNG